MARRILLVDDEPLIVKGLKYSLEQELASQPSELVLELILVLLASPSW